MFGLKTRLQKVSALAVLVAMGAAPAMTLAEDPAMAAITFPITTASIVTAVVAAGATLLLAYFGPKVGFSFVKKLLGRLHRAV